MNLREALAYARDNYHAMIYSDLCILGVVYVPTLMSADFHIMEVAIDKDLRIHGFDYYRIYLNHFHLSSFESVQDYRVGADIEAVIKEMPEFAREVNYQVYTLKNRSLKQPCRYILHDIFPSLPAPDVDLSTFKMAVIDLLVQLNGQIDEQCKCTLTINPRFRLEVNESDYLDKNSGISLNEQRCIIKRTLDTVALAGYGYELLIRESKNPSIKKQYILWYKDTLLEKTLMLDELPNQIKRLIAAHKELRQQQLLSELGSRMKLDWAWGVYSGDYYPRVLNINIPPACKMGDLVANQVFGL